MAQPAFGLNVDPNTGGLAIADRWETRQHAAHLRELGWLNVRRRNLGWRMWYGGPWFSTRLVTATKAA